MILQTLTFLNLIWRVFKWKYICLNFQLSMYNFKKHIIWWSSRYLFWILKIEIIYIQSKTGIKGYIFMSLTNDETFASVKIENVSFSAQWLCVIHSHLFPSFPARSTHCCGFFCYELVLSILKLHINEIVQCIPFLYLTFTLTFFVVFLLLIHVVINVNNLILLFVVVL